MIKLHRLIDLEQQEFLKRNEKYFHHFSGAFIDANKTSLYESESPILNEKSILKRHNLSIVQAIYIFLHMNYTFYMSHFQCYVLPLIYSL